MTAVDDAGQATDAETPESFRARVQAWLDRHAPRKGEPGDFSSAHVFSAPTPQEYDQREREALQITKAWQRRIFDAGFAGLAWPREYGGVDGPKWQDEIVAEEQSRYGVSTKMLAVALEMVPPVLFEYGSDEQRAQHLPAVLRGEESWCQLLSEPGAGSDLGRASGPGRPRSRVVGHVTGQKVWTSGAGTADVRAPPGPERAIARTRRVVVLHTRYARSRCGGAPIAPDVGWVPLQRGFPL